MQKAPLIVCVDDEKAILDTLERQILSGFNGACVIELAEGVDEAWEVINEFSAEHDFRLVISDWLMPGVNGDKFLQDLHQKHPNVHKIMLSGYADPAIVDDANHNAYLNAFISKPWDANELLTIIENAVANHATAPQQKAKKVALQR